MGGRLCRYSYIDFLRFSWGTLMVNQFEHTNIAWTQGAEWCMSECTSVCSHMSVLQV
jgi:hypothetical protein